MRYPKLRELKEAIKALIKGPYTSKFPFQPHGPFERFRGNPKFYEQDCMGCTACVQVCPTGALSFEDKLEKDTPRRLLTHRLDLCIFCGQCEANCPTTKGIKLSREFDLATTERRQGLLKDQIEKELILCDGCGELIAPYDQILWVARKLGPLTFSNTSLMLFYLRKLTLALKEKPSTIKEEPKFIRSDRIKILCPRCRREAVLKS